ncbi:hypothetical protein [Tenuifilum thalassicum]|uniref:M3 family oligoendopeptidase n=1 Tax=Tenuifilum thalassicum TaxID=2590900 RepID=A0A7D4AWN4_9BACT|nr:hypothetical protein [Tenuifilum thalassicum]QKG79614.1 hypothetical protein FHG85_04835 [Tenuifilum thalassicum]
MKRLLTLLSISSVLLMTQCKQADKADVSPIGENTVKKVTAELVKQHGDSQKVRIEKGVAQVASLWRVADGTEADFENFCKEQFVSNEKDLDLLFNKLSYGFEMLNGYFILLSKELLRPLHLDMGPVTQIDELFGSYNAGAHLTDDLFANKIAFITALNFPYYSLKEKTELGENWSRKQWAYARMGDMFTSRVPAELIQNFSTVNTNSDTYISQYNIFMGNLVDDQGNTMFPSDLKLISHWGLRDELKAQYADKQDGLKRQQMIYQVMKRIIEQTIPTQVINSDEYQWNPFENVILKDGEKQEATPEPNTRYQHIINQFKALKAIDSYTPQMPTYIQRKFEGEFELPVDDVEKLFIELVSSKEIRETGKLISRRLGRPLQPFDIWYDGFKARSGIPAEKLDAITTKRFPNTQAFEKEMPNILTSLGWSFDKAKFIAERVKVESSRGAGHAWGAEMHKDVALLRTRVPESGMNYKGFNIAMHEFGHTVEQTITLHDVDYYMMHGVPNTAFTEALAFVFQKRDLDVLGMKEENPNKEYLATLDNLWSCYEIMGVSLVDINLWKWLYAHPDATAQEVKEATIKIAKDIWNKYYADVFGSKDEPILAVYSHMIDNPLYLSAYPIGQLIEFQLEKQFKGRSFANEVERIFSQGRLIPQLWLKHGVGETLSVKPILEASDEALKNLE